MIQKFAENISVLLKSELPGKEAQNKMAPNIRNIEALIKKIQPGKKESGVLVLFYPSNDEIRFVLIKRPDYNGPHGGQVSFPGGKKEEQDGDLIETALREAEEEIGIRKEDVKVIGPATPLFIPVSSSQVLPVYGWLDYTPEFIPEPKEVDHVIETSVFRLTDNDVVKTETIQIEDRVIDAPYFDIKGYHVWGATAMMLSELRELLHESVFSPE